MSTHTLAVLVEDKPGVLARVAGLFSRRGFNIDSLAVGPTELEGISRMTIVVDAAAQPLEQVTKQLNKLVHVLKIVELPPEASCTRELQLVKVAAGGESRAQVLQIAEDLDAVTLEATGSADKLEAMVRLLAPYGIRELVRSGTLGIGRGSKSITEGRALRLERSA
jgi:acetolactate synthase I/III small subunit